MPSTCSPAWVRAVPEPASGGRQRHGGGWLLAALGAALAWGAVPAVMAAPRVQRVAIENMAFNPPTLTVRQGDRVVWSNRDLVPHTVTAASAASAVLHPGFDSHPIAPNASWTYVARKPGRYAYACTLHPAMQAVLIVQ